MHKGKTAFLGMVMLFLWSSPFCAAHSFDCKNLPPLTIDVLSGVGVQTDKIPGSRLEYNPFPVGYKIGPGHSLQIDFRTESPSGLIFLATDYDFADMVSVYLRKGRLAFARLCGSGRAFEIYQERLDDGKWHTLTYFHTENGGRLLVDGRNVFRQYHIGPCVGFTSILFGGLNQQMADGMNFNHIVDTNADVTECDLASRHRFSGCFRNLRFDSRRPTVNPRYVAVSECQN